MPEAVSYEFTGVSDADYAAVSRHLNIDPETETGDWPPGLLSHAAGTADDGAFIVAEVWSSRRIRRHSCSRGSARRWRPRA